ncbi:MAG: DUF1338 domain-containing protein, partial [Comamonadaceae bacterium]
SRHGSNCSLDWMSGILGQPVADPYDLYAAQRQESLDRVARQLGLSNPITISNTTVHQLVT